MRHLSRIVLTVLFVSGAGCAGESPTEAEVPILEPAFGRAGNSGCFTVEGAISETGVFPNFSGAISGDLVGTTATTLSFDVRSTGAVIHNPGKREISVTGGSIPALIGQTVLESFHGLSIDDGSDLVRINERTRLDGAGWRGNLTTHGTLNLGVFPWAVEVTYRGQVCQR